ncbi:mitochondrial import inner membrane translocase subunit TIM23 [Paragonimus westermani]|uniref:Mitochondrial import inner membrane translocase subunit TIM23 n=1 Tax=Paragonimus westermani TaxID=34504 RepID=A0A5J4NCL7_9TREM|nr:mitochondrial import inner membrane translocase subunit TIM23 [Paragonimus westermani]
MYSTIIDTNIFVSPFLNFDPSLLVSNSDEQFIFPEGEKHRGRFERSFSEIGAMVIGGASLGGARGLYLGLSDADIKQLPTLAIRRTQILNHVTKSGATLAQTAGAIGLIYALADFAIHKLRNGADDEINTVTAATATGCLYKSPELFRTNLPSLLLGVFKPGGWQRCLRGGAVGLIVGAGAVAFTSWSHIKQMLGG